MLHQITLYTTVTEVFCKRRRCCNSNSSFNTTCLLSLSSLVLYTHVLYFNHYIHCAKSLSLSSKYSIFLLMCIPCIFNTKSPEASMEYNSEQLL